MNFIKDEYCKQIIESIEEGVILADHEEKITFMNQKAQIILGHTGSRAIGRNLDGILKLYHYRNDRPYNNLKQHLFQNNGVLNVDDNIYLIDAQNQEKPISLHALITKDDDKNLSGILVIIQDRSLLKEYEIEMQK